MDIGEIQFPLSPQESQRLKDLAQQVKDGLITKRVAVRLSAQIIKGKGK